MDTELILKQLIEDALINERGVYVGSKLKHAKPLISLLEKTPIPNCETVAEKIWVILNGPRPVCVVCGNNTALRSIPAGFKRTCSAKCSANDPEKRLKASKTRTENDSFGQVRKDIMIARYGVDNNFARASVKEKIKKTNLVRYGAENPMQNNSVRARLRESNLQKYGVEYSVLHPSVREKIIDSVYSRFGVKCAANNKDLLDKYRSDTKSARFARCVSLVSGFQPLFTEDGFINQGMPLNWKCLACGENVTTNGAVNRIRCPRCSPPGNVIETEVAEFIRSISSDTIVRHDRSVISPLELDLYIPERRLAIEVNGVYWHSDQFKDINYHLQKTIQAGAAGIRLVHIFENDWINSKHIVKSQILSLFGMSVTIAGRKCTVEKLAFSDVRQFLTDNHLQGAGTPTKVVYGLRYGADLVAVATFGKPRFNKSYDWELIRFCTAINHTVVGGMSRLMKAFEKEFAPQTILSYADQSRFTGSSYEKCGFKLEGTTAPGYFYISKTGEKLSRHQATAAKLNSILGTTGLTEQEAAEELGLARIWNCGNLVFVKTNA